MRKQVIRYLGAGQKEREMNKEYYQAKADLCRDLFIQQVTDENVEEASKNLFRMVSALSQLEMINYKEEKGNEAS
jgi:endonuclease III